MPSHPPTSPGSLRMLAISILTVTVATQPVFLLASGSPQMGPEFGFGAVGLGLFTTAFFIAASLSSTPAGKLVERIGWPNAMRVSTLGAISSLLTIAAFARSQFSLGVLLIVAAGFYGFANPAANLALARYARPGRRATFFGLKHAGIPGSTLVAGLTVPLINLNWGWRWSYVAAAAVGVVLLLMIPRVAPPPREAATQARAGEEMSSQALVRLTLAAALMTTAAIALGTFTVPAALDAGLSEGAAGWTLSIAGFASISARAVYGRWVDNRGADGLTTMALVVSVGTAAVAALAFLTGAWFVAVTIVAFATAWGWPGLLTYSVVQGNNARPAEATARAQAGVFVGAGLTPPLFGWLVDQVDFVGAWLVVAASLAVGVIVARSATRTNRRQYV